MNLTIGDLLMTKPYSVCHISPEASVSEALKLMCKQATSLLVVLDGSKIKGVVSEVDILPVLLTHTDDLGTFLSSSVSMVLPKQEHVYTVKMGDDVFKALKIMKNKHIRHLPVVEDDGFLLNLISLHDVLSAIGEHFV